MIRRIAVLVFALSVFGCGDDTSKSAEEVEPDVDTLFQAGVYEVGYMETTVSYRPPGETEDRNLPVKIWYPAATNSGAANQVYKVAGIVNVPSGGVLAAPPIAGDGLPVAVYSHGSGGEGLLAYPFAEKLASDGWLVLAPNHIGNTALDSLSGNFAPYAKNVIQRPLDISAVLDAVESGLEGPVGSAGDVDRVLLFGHSFGGYTTLAVTGAGPNFEKLVTNSCSTAEGDGSCLYLENADVEAQVRAGFLDERVDAIVPQAPALLGVVPAEALSTIRVPTLLQSGKEDVTLPDETHALPVWNGLDGQDDIWVQMPAGGHYSFISICTDLEEDLLLSFRPGALEDGCGEDSIPTTESLPVLTAYIRAFANEHVLGLSGWTELIDSEPLAGGFEVQTR